MKEVTALTSIEYSQARFLFLVRKVFLFFWLVPSLKGRLATQKKKKKEDLLQSICCNFFTE